LARYIAKSPPASRAVTVGAPAWYSVTPKLTGARAAGLGRAAGDWDSVGGPEATGRGAGLLVNMLSAPARAEKGEGKEAHGRDA
jgi:hypothetical protein